MSILKQIPKKHCEYCDEEIKGRSDKRFCNDDCRNNYHNFKNSLNDAYLRKVNRVLRQNRRILQEINPEGKGYSTRVRLEDKGFNFNYFTSMRPARDGGYYFYCYEEGYLEIKTDYFLLVRREVEERKEPSGSSPAAETDRK